MGWLIAIVTGLAFVAFLWWWGFQPAKHRVYAADLARYLDVLRERGSAGAFMMVDLPGRPARFLQFAKYVGGTAREGIELAFPLAPWSEPYYQRVCEELERSNVPIRREKTGRNDTREFVDVDFGGNVDLAASVSVSILRSVFEIPEDRKVTVWFQGVNELGTPKTPASSNG